ncbi:MAG: hypothetical protein JSU06_08755 [Actinobacteria bacterium]|nr:hypothetical protein [Actinomycetota bacterium]
MTKICRLIALPGTVALVAMALYAAVGADAAGTFAVRAAAPAYDASSLELGAQGSFTAARPQAKLRVTVCLEKRFGGRSFPVRCATATAAGTQVDAVVAVPGCVKGTWRTTVTGEARSPGGGWAHRASATSRRFHC